MKHSGCGLTREKRKKEFPAWAACRGCHSPRRKLSGSYQGIYVICYKGLVRHLSRNAFYIIDYVGQELRMSWTRNYTWDFSALSY